MHFFSTNKLHRQFPYQYQIDNFLRIKSGLLRHLAVDSSNLLITSSWVIPLGSLKLTITVINFQQNKILIFALQLFTYFVGNGLQKVLLDYSVLVNYCHEWEFTGAKGKKRRKSDST